MILRREDLNHTGSHKINNAVGQVGCTSGAGTHCKY
jgi:tryptophan synthase beta subunit